MDTTSRGAIALVEARLCRDLTGSHWQLGNVLPRLRCESCGGKPSSMVLMDRGDDSADGAQAS